MYIRKAQLTNYNRFHEVVMALSALSPKVAWQSYAPEYYPKSGESSFSLKIELSSRQLYEAHLKLTTKSLLQTNWFRHASRQVFGGE